METARTDQVFEDIIETIREPLLILTQDFRVVTVSRSFYDFFKVKPEETVGQLIYDLGNKQWASTSILDHVKAPFNQKSIIGFDIMRRARW